MSDSKISLHEAMELHEMLNFKTVSMVKSKMMEGVVFDQDLKTMLEKDVQQSITAIDGLQTLLMQAPKLQTR